MQVHVSIHDVTPAWENEVEHLLALTKAVGVKPALLVVPNYHDHALLDAKSAFADRLRSLAGEGHEIYLHGFYHLSGVRRAAPEVSALTQFFRQKVVSAGEAEFADLNEREGTERIDRGLSLLAELGLPVHGFIPPAWSRAPWLLPVLRSRGIAFTEDHTHVYDPSLSRSRRSLVLNYASRTPSRLFSSAAFVRLARPVGHVLPTRIALHPADMKYMFLRRETEELLTWAKSHGQWVTGQELLAN